MKGIQYNYCLAQYRKLTYYYLNLGFSYEKAQKLAYVDVWGSPT